MRIPKVPLTNQEFKDWLSRRRSDSIPVIEVPVLDLSFSDLRFLHCLYALIHREQVWRIREVCRRSKRDDIKIKRNAYNMHPKISKRRHAHYQRYRKDPDKLKLLRKRGIAYFHANKPKVYAYRKEQRRTNPQYKISCNLRTYIFQKVGKKNRYSESRFKQIVGCPIEVFCQWLEAHFEPWMTWDNYGMGDGKWSIDHTRPCASFDLTDDAQLKACFHYSNMLPMGWRENMFKRDKLSPLPIP